MQHASVGDTTRSIQAWPPRVTAEHALGKAFSPLVLADRLISMAEEADAAGLHDSATGLISLAYRVMDDLGAGAPA